MLSHFFQTGFIPADQMTGTFDLRLVVLSYVVATFASYIALDITGRLRDPNNTRMGTVLWLVGGAFAMGAGIWSMHFIGMLAFSMASMPINFEPMWTVLSMIVAVLASGFALFMLTARVIKWTRLAIGGIILGLAIASMHYVGMQAMTIDTVIHYKPFLFSLSIVIAIVASEAALWLAIKSTQVILQYRFRLKVVSAFIMGAAICGMHYTGMAAAVFTPLTVAPQVTNLINPQLLAINIAGVTILIMGIAFIASTSKEALNQQLFATMRQAGMAEVGATVLHNVGNVLNSVNVSANLVSEKIAKSKLKRLSDLSNLINEHKQDLANFFTQDEAGSHLPEYISKLSEYWQNEQADLTTEISSLLKNIQHIKDIISMQQNLSKVKGVEQVVSVEYLLEEALLITNMNPTSTGITIYKKYNHLKPVLIDKVKLLQILVNLIRNAKDSLRNSENTNKTLTLKFDTDGKDKFYIQISDNGIGIDPADVNKIFAHGFTTKPSGHGFGLHSSALSAKEMGGSIQVQSEGVNKGASFTVELPYKLPL